MKTILLLLVSVFYFSCCLGSEVLKDTNIWGKAQWIGYERLEDSMKIVPGVHGDGALLGNKGRNHSVVPMFRKKFILNPNTKMKRTTVHISGLGHYELRLNGIKPSDHFLAPGWSNYLKRCYYNTYDVTDLVQRGENVIGVLVGNGFFNVNRERYRKLVIAYGYPRLIFNIRIEYENGQVENICSDESCKVTQSPVTFSSIYGGEDYDSRLEQDDWDKPDFDDISWRAPVILTDPIGSLEREPTAPLKVMQEFDAKEIIISQTGKTIYDFRQNCSGIIGLKVKGNKGAKIRIRPGELIDDQGNITQQSSGGPYEYNYILKGEGIEYWQPKFTYYGFRYADVEIIEPEGIKPKTEIIELKLLHTRNSAPTVGSFSCSSEQFNKIFELINWGIKSNMASVATDCPHREKLGWLEVVHLLGPSIHYNYDIHDYYSKIVTDMIDAQLDNGLVPDIAPEFVPFKGGFRDSPEWGSSSIIVPWQIYHWYDDETILRKAYPMMKKYVAYLESKSNGGILSHGLGDWYDLGPKPPGEAQLTPKAVTATAIYFYDLKIISQIAKVIGKMEDFVFYRNRAEKVKNAFLSEFYNSETGVVSTGSQTAYAMSLYTDLVPGKDKQKVLTNLIDSIIDNGYSLTSGDVGYHFLVRTLSKNGRSDVLYQMNKRSDRPGYGYQLKKGATALTESWNARPQSSNNHMMLGHLMEWFYTGLAGIYQSENSVGYSNIVIAPKPVGDIKWVKCKYKSVKGDIASEWEIKEDSFILNVEIPKNCTAIINIPDNFKNHSCEIVDLSNASRKSMKNNVVLRAGRYRIVANS